MARFNSLLTHLLIFLFVPGLSLADEVPTYFTYQGRLLNSAGTGPLNAVVDLKFQVFSPSGSCLLYEEIQTGIDLSLSSGVFAAQVGSPVGSTKRTANDPGMSMAALLSNSGSQIRANDSGSTNTCPGGYTPSNGDSRNLRVTVIEGSIPTVLTPDQVISSQPYATVAQTLQGVTPSGFIRSNGLAGLTQVNAELLVSGNDASSLHHHDSRYIKKGDSVNQDLGSGNVYTTGRIGVGTASPATDIEVETSAPKIRLDATTGGSSSQIQFHSDATERARIESPEDSNELRIYTGGLAAVTIDANQNANFTSNVRLKGFLDLGDYDNTQEGTLGTYLSGTCGVACAGSIWFNTDLGLLRYWDGSTIASLGTDNTKLSLDGSDTMTGNLNMGGFTIVGVATPVNGTDAANKAYVDSVVGAVSSSVSGDFVDRDGSTALTGNWNVGGFDLNNLGNVSIAAQKTLGVGHLDNAQETTLTGSFTTAHTGKVWYNTDTNTLKVWTGSSAQSLGVVGGSLASLNGETGSTQTFGAPGVNGTAPAWVSGSNVHTLNIPMANTASVTAGLISKTEFDDFDQKQDGDQQLTDIAAIDPSTTSGSYVYSDGTNLVTRTTANLKTDLSLGTMADETATDYLLRDGSLSMTGALNMEGHLVSNVATPVSSGDATTKGYVDAAIGAISTSASGAYLTIADNLSDLSSVATARTNLGLGTMAEETATDYLLRDGTLSMTGALNLSGNDIASVDLITGTSAIFGEVTIAGGIVTNLSSPSDAGDAANKAYVDAQIAAVSTAASSGYLGITSNLSDLDNATTARANLGVEIGVDVQGFDAQLTDIAAIDPAVASGSYVYSDGTNLTTRTLANLKTDLSLGTMADETATDYLLRDGSLSMTGALNMEGHLINNLATPTGASDATTKAYVDAAIGAVSTSAAGDYVSRDGSTTLTGDWNVGGYVLSNATLEAVSGSAVTPSISFDGDEDTGIFSPGANTIAMSTGGVRRLTLDSSGNLGLGSASPGAMIHAEGAGNLFYFGATGGGRLSALASQTTLSVNRTLNNTAAVMSITSSDTGSDRPVLQVQGNSGSTQTLWAGADGRVGIGTIAPGTRLDVAGSITVGDGNEDCTGGDFIGAIRYNGGLQFCNGSSWQTLGISGAGMQSLEGQTGGTQTLSVATASSVLVPTWSSASNDHELQFPNASATGVTAGLLSKTDYDSFASKQDGDQQLTDIAAIDPSAATGSYIYSDGTNLVTRTVANLKTDLSLGTMADESATDYLLRDGSLSMTGDLNLGENLISNLGAPVAGTDATNKSYVDAAISTVSDFASENYLALDGTSTMSGNINLGGNYLSGDGGSEGVYVDSNGNVGIGTLSPGKTLDVNGAIRTGNGHFITNHSSGAMVFNSGPASSPIGGFHFRTNDTLGEEGSYEDLVLIDRNGNVGIGTTNANAGDAGFTSTTLAVADDATPGLNLISKGTAAADGDRVGVIHFIDQTNGSGTVPNMYAGLIDMVLTGSGGTNGYGADMRFFTKADDGNYTANMVINQSGNVGIGTTSPGAPLEISSSGGESLLLRDNNSLESDGSFSSFIRAKDSAGTNVWYLGDGSSSSRDVRLYAYQPGTPLHFGTNSLTRMTILDNGNVGIGRTNPVYQLDVAGSTRTDGEFISTLGGSPGQARYISGDYGIIHRNDGSDYYILSTNSGDQYGSWNALRPFRVNIASGDVQLAGGNFVAKHDGNVGIGTTAPGSKFEVSGSGTGLMNLNGPSGTGYAGLEFREAGSTRWMLYSAGVNDNIYFGDSDNSNGVYMTQNGAGWTNYSDQRLKENIAEYSVLDKIDNFRTVTFDWKKSKKSDIGVIAQELFLIFPEVVDQGDSDTNRDIASLDENGVWGVHYDRMGPLALQGVKEIHQAIDVSNYTETHTPAVFIDEPGNVGIGTTSPVEKLEVKGGVKATSFNGMNIFEKLGNNGAVSCDNFCTNGTDNWGKPGSCLGQKRLSDGKYFSCADVVNSDVSCMCGSW